MWDFAAGRGGMLASTMALGLRSRLLAEAGFAHAFFLRAGGPGPAPGERAVFSTGPGASEQAAAASLACAAAELGVDPARVYWLEQVHGTTAHVVRGHESRAEVALRQGDITLSRTAGVGCAVRTADCVAVLLGDRRSGAAAAIHSGWRGTVRGAVRAGVAALRALTGGDGELVAAVGPHIERCCFEVSAEVALALGGASALGETVVDRSRPRPHVDLRRVIEAQLCAEGVGAVDHVAGCTRCDAVRFHSYRRDGQGSGRMLAVVVAHRGAVAVRSWPPVY